MKVSAKQELSRPRTIEDLLRRYDFDAIERLKKAVKLSEKELNKINKTLEKFVSAVVGSIGEQADGSVITWFCSGTPLLSVYPSNEWTTDELKEAHVGDLYYDKDTGYAYQFIKTGGTYIWELASEEITESMALANAELDTGDGKRRVFVVRPSPPYDQGDIWYDEGEIYICQFPKTEGEYEETDFVTAANYNTDIEKALNFLTTNYYTTVEVDSALLVNKESILSTVSKQYVTNSAYNGLTQKVETLQTTATQTAEKFNWIVASGTSASDFTLTDRMATLTAQYINLNGLVTFGGLEAATQSKINTANTNASAAVTTANSAKTAADNATSAASTANTNASSALTKANTAITTANSASSTATTANTTANTALSTANTANTTANSALLRTEVENVIGNVKKFKNVCAYTSDSDNVKGYLVITTPVLPNRMVNMHIQGYNYVGANETIDLTVGFYNYSGGFVSAGFVNKGSFPISNVQVAKVSSSDQRAVVLIGIATTVWQYPKIIVDEVITGYSTVAPDSYKDGFSATITATLPATYTHTTTLSGTDLKALSVANDLAIANWCHESDKTYIDGAKIYAGSVTAKEINVADLFAKDITATGTIRGVKLVGASGSFSGEVSATSFSFNNTINGLQRSLQLLSSGDIQLQLVDNNYATPATYTSIVELMPAGGLVISGRNIEFYEWDVAHFTGNINFSNTVTAGSVKTSAGADLDTVKDNTTWRKCTVTANSAAGKFNGSSSAKYRYDDDVLEVCIRGSYVTSATISKGNILMTIGDLNVAIPTGMTAPMWDDSAQTWRRVSLNTNGSITLASNASIPANCWLSSNQLRFTMFRN